MFDSVALDVVIGLIFIYLLYSLLATVLSEIIATKLSLRARNLKEAVNRMLTDEKDKNFLGRLWDSMRLLKNPKNEIVQNFYDHPEIKYLGSSGLFRDPSTFKAVSFSKTLLSVLFGHGPITNETITSTLENALKPPVANEKRILDPDTARYILNLWEESGEQVAAFKVQLEGWFDRTMEQTSEWYKRKIQVVLLIIGFCIAWLFNMDTFEVVGKLSNDKDARDKIVSMANTYAENHQNVNVTPTAATPGATEAQQDSLYRLRLDTLQQQAQDLLNKDIANANSILGTGAWLPDSIKVERHAKTGELMYTPQVDASLIRNLDHKLRVAFKAKPGETKQSAYIKITGNYDKWAYFFSLLCAHFFGFLVTAIAISLGAPFWFDLLNKLMKLRTSPKQDADTGSTAGTQPISIQVNTQPTEEAVG